MHDQAASLRRQVEQMRTGKETKVVSVVSGKGGVGKTNISVNLAIGLSKLGKKVLIVDLDIGMANIDIVTGVKANKTIIDMIEQELSIFDIITEGPAGISIIAGGSGISKFFQIDSVQFSYFVKQLEQINYHYDYVFFDLGAGISKESLNFILASHEMLVILTPEPTSITDGYALIKTVLAHEQLPIYIIVNSCDSEDEGYETATRFKRTAREFLNLDVSIVGTLPFDRTVSKAVQAQVPFLLYAPKSKISHSMDKLVYSYSGHQLDENTRFDSFISKFSKLFLAKLKKR